MNNNNKIRAKSLRALAAELGEIHDAMKELSEQLQGGGITLARDIEQPIADALPRLQHAVTVLQTASANGNDDGDAREPGAAGEPNQSPLLM